MLFLQLGFVLLRELRLQARRQKRHQVHALVFFYHGGRADLGIGHGNGEQARTLDLHQRRAPVSHFQHALDEFTGTFAGLV